MSSKHLFRSTLGLLGFVTCASALEWERTLVEISIDEGQAEAAASFPYKNTSDKAVTIDEIKASCGCATPILDSKTVEAGTAGVLKVPYHPGKRSGLQNLTITLKTDERGAATESLTLRVNIIPLADVAPRLVRWTKDDVRLPKTVEIAANSKTPIRVSDVKTQSDALTADLRQPKEGGPWILALTPKSLDAIFTEKIDVTVTAAERSSTYTVYAICR